MVVYTMCGKKKKNADEGEKEELVSRRGAGI
jgi:hypothetical protein